MTGIREKNKRVVLTKKRKKRNKGKKKGRKEENGRVALAFCHESSRVESSRDRPRYRDERSMKERTKITEEGNGGTGAGGRGETETCGGTVSFVFDER